MPQSKPLFTSAPPRSGRERRRAGLSFARAIACCLGVCTALTVPALALDVKTHHYDGQRTGWNSLETVLNVANVGGGNFGQQWNIQLDSGANAALNNRIDAQPLVVSQLKLADQSVHDVVYVATETNTIYMIDGATGATLNQVNLGTPVPRETLPGYCKSSGYVNGINSTPVLSKTANTIWVMAYTYENNTQIYRLHALDLVTLTDKVPPVTVQATGKLTDGTTYSFNARVNKQRPALLFANGFIYAAFGSHCDIEANISRGWVMGWNATSLKPLSRAELPNKLPPGPDRLLDAIWQSGAGPAASVATPGSPSSSIYFITGNTDKSGTMYDPVNNLSMSVIGMDLGLHAVQTFFTPSNVADLDMGDRDFSSGGIMVLPNQPGNVPHIGAAAGKDGRMFLLNLDNMGGFTPGGPDNVLGVYDIGACFCQPSYFEGNDRIPRIVSSGGGSTNPAHPSSPQIKVWKLDTSGPKPLLTLENQSAVLASGQRGGFFTSISSNGRKRGTGVIWAVTHPVDPVNANNPSGADVPLHAFDPTTMNEIWSGVAGTWPDVQSANVVPVVANGRVYVATFNQLRMFGLNPPAAPLAKGLARSARVAALSGTVGDAALGPDEHQLSGKVTQIDGLIFALEDRNGRVITVDMSEGVDEDHAVEPSVGDAVQVRGKYDRGGKLQANVVIYAGESAKFWEADR